jgi:hypothetical protein
MDVSSDGAPRRPYAAAANVVAVLERSRSRNLPPEIGDDFLRVAQIPDVVFGRVKDALRFLGLIDSTDRPSDTLKALAAAPSDEYPELLAAVIRNAYREDFERINPAEDSQAQIVAAFQPYEPRSQTKRMVMLFLGLCREAAIEVMDAPRDRKMKPRGDTRPKSTSTPRAAAATASSGSNSSPISHRVTPGLLFGVSESDIAALDPADFDEVWTALGKIARARALKAAIPPSAAEGTSEGGGA